MRKRQARFLHAHMRNMCAATALMSFSCIEVENTANATASSQPLGTASSLDRKLCIGGFSRTANILARLSWGCPTAGSAPVATQQVLSSLCCSIKRTAINTTSLPGFAQFCQKPASSHLILWVEAASRYHDGPSLLQLGIVDSGLLVMSKIGRQSLDVRNGDRGTLRRLSFFCLELMALQCRCAALCSFGTQEIHKSITDI